MDQGIVIRPSVTCEGDLVPLADLVRRHLQGNQNVLEGYSEYTFADWKADRVPYFRINGKEKN
jgi:hypothetical protein